MSDFPESVGGIVEGGLVAHAAEPDASGAKPSDDGHTSEQACLNCGTSLIGTHCHSCGQRAHIHRTLSAFFHDLLHGVLHFEGKLWRTLPVWVFNPGKLTREYIEGKRAKYVSPIALFLFVVFLTFALFNALGGAVQWSEDAEVTTATELQEAHSLAQIELVETRRKLETTTPGSDLETDVQAQIKRLEEQQSATAAILELAGVEVAASEPELEVSGAVPSSKINDAWKKAKKNPQLLIYKLQTNTYKFSWMLIPLSLPFMWLLFPFSRKFRMYDHTVFVTYSIAFMIALIGIVSVFGYLGMATGAALLLYAPFHLYRHLRGTYSLGRFGAFWRLSALSIFCWIAIALFIAGLSIAVGT